MERSIWFLQRSISRLEREAETHAARLDYRGSVALIEEACRLCERLLGDPRGAPLGAPLPWPGSKPPSHESKNALLSFRPVLPRELETQRFDALSHACALNVLGVLRCQLGQHRQALRPFRRALEITRCHRAAEGAIHSMVASNLAGANFSLRRFQIAETLYQEALESLEKLEEPGPSAVGELLYCLCSLAELRELGGDRRAALGLANRALDVAQEASAERPAKVAESLARLADFYGRVEEFQMALSLIRQSARLLEASGCCHGEDLLGCFERWTQGSAGALGRGDEEGDRR